MHLLQGRLQRAFPQGGRPRALGVRWRAREALRCGRQPGVVGQGAFTRGVYTGQGVYTGAAPAALLLESFVVSETGKVGVMDSFPDLNYVPPSWRNATQKLQHVWSRRIPSVREIVLKADT